MHADDVRMKQRGGQLGFAVEPTPEFGVGRDIGRQDLERVVTRQPRMLGQVDLAHPPRPKQPDNPVPGEHLTATIMSQALSIGADLGLIP
jgi:hypothetical protein